MEKGKLIVNKKGNAKVKRADKKEVSSPKEYDYSEFTPQSGRNRIECEYEVNEQGQVTKVFVNGKELPKDTKAAEEKEKKEERKRKIIEAKEKEKQVKKQYASQIQKMKTCSFNLKSNEDDFYFPKDSYDILVGNEWKVDNFYLRLKRGARFDNGRNSFNFFNTKRGGVLYKIQENFGDFDFSGQCQRIENQIITPYKKISFSPDWRMIVGLGNASVYETSITLHHIYGIPYIPASTIKGVVRSQVIKEIFLPKHLSDNDEKANEKANEKAEEEAMSNPVFKLFFGNQEQKGKLIFYDAFPTSSPKIEVDVMNPHYGSYYSDSSNTKAPVDSDNPKPIFFLTVTGCAFQFLISSKSNKLFEKYFDADSKKKNITQWLTESLQNHGIGAKTAIGYGYMDKE